MQTQRLDIEKPVKPLMSSSSPIPGNRLPSRTNSKIPDSVVDAIVEALSGVQYGQVTVTVQDGLVVQIDRMERKRLKP